MYKIIRDKFPKCRTVKEFQSIRNEMELYGKERFYQEMEKEGAFLDKIIHFHNNPFGQMMLGKKEEEFIKLGSNYILVDNLENPRHKFLVPRIFSWESFNVLTLDKNHLYLIEEMKEMGIKYGRENKYKELGLFFHCYPYNTVHCLHLHIVDLFSHPEVKTKTNNLDIDIVLKVLKND